MARNTAAGGSALGEVGWRLTWRGWPTPGGNVAEIAALLIQSNQLREGLLRCNARCRWSDGWGGGKGRVERRAARAAWYFYLTRLSEIEKKGLAKSQMNCMEACGGPIRALQPPLQPPTIQQHPRAFRDGGAIVHIINSYMRESQHLLRAHRGSQVGLKMVTTHLVSHQVAPSCHGRHSYFMLRELHSSVAGGAHLLAL